MPSVAKSEGVNVGPGQGSHEDASHVAAFIGEVAAIAQWVKRREKPQPWHGAGIAACWVSTLPALSFFSSPDVYESYANWVLRGLVGLHLWVLAMVGGAKLSTMKKTNATAIPATCK
jgi:peptidoglycan/LPS O-acetylase OafA/YrhL